jgi:hypothetical protein
MQKVKIKSGSWSGNTAKIIGASSDTTLLIQLFSSHRKITVKKDHVELLPPEKVSLPSRAIGALDFSNPYTEQD